jgi:hypothetical protein
VPSSRKSSTVSYKNMKSVEFCGLNRRQVGGNGPRNTSWECVTQECDETLSGDRVLDPLAFASTVVSL